MPLAPYNRRELFLEAIRTRDTSALPDPNNREELFLKDIADQVAAIPAGIPVSVPAELSELLANLPEPHTHTERFYNDIIGALLVTTTVTDTTPFITRETAGGLSVSGTAELKKKIGNTVGVNQLVNPANYEADKTVSGVSFEKLADGQIKITVASSPASAVRFRVTNVNVFTLGHKYLFSLQNNYGAGKLNVMIANTTYSSIAVGSDNLYDTIWQAVGDVTQWAFIVNVRAGCATGTYYVRPISSDLDRWFGSTDRIPADLLAHPENWGKYYAGSLDYNAGTLESADGTVLRSIGRNQLPSGSFPNTITGYANALTEAQRTAILDCLKRLQKITAKVHYIVDADKTGPYVGEFVGYFIVQL